MFTSNQLIIKNMNNFRRIYCGFGPNYQNYRQLNYIQKRLNNNFNNNNKSIDNNMNESEERLIYSAPQSMVKMIKIIKTFSISTTLIAGGVQPFIYQQILSSSSPFAIGFASVTSLGVVMSPLILNWFTKRYVTQLYYDFETQLFKAWVLNLFNRKVSITYKADEVLVPEILGIFTTYTVGAKKKPLFVDPNFVIDFNTYKMMLGYDKPIDFKINKSRDH